MQWQCCLSCLSFPHLSHSVLAAAHHSLWAPGHSHLLPAASHGGCWLN